MFSVRSAKGNAEKIHWKRSCSRQGNLSQNWKRFKRQFENYAIASLLCEATVRTGINILIYSLVTWVMKETNFENTLLGNRLLYVKNTAANMMQSRPFASGRSEDAVVCAGVSYSAAVSTRKFVQFVDYKQTAGHKMAALAVVFTPLSRNDFNKPDETLSEKVLRVRFTAFLSNGPLLFLLFGSPLKGLAHADLAKKRSCWIAAISE